MSIDRDYTMPSLPSIQADIKPLEGAKRPAGKFGSGIHNIGLALMRLDSAQKDNAEFIIDEAGSDLRIKPFIPEWWPIEDESS